MKFPWPKIDKNGDLHVSSYECDPKDTVNKIFLGDAGSYWHAIQKYLEHGIVSDTFAKNPEEDKSLVVPGLDHFVDKTYRVEIINEDGTTKIVRLTTVTDTYILDKYYTSGYMDDEDYTWGKS